VVVGHLAGVGEILVVIEVPLLHGHVVDVARRVGGTRHQVAVAVALLEALPGALAAPEEARRAIEVALVRHDLQDAAVPGVVLVLRRRVPGVGLVLLHLDQAIPVVPHVLVVAVGAAVLSQISRIVVGQADLRVLPDRPRRQLVDAVVHAALGH